MVAPQLESRNSRLLLGSPSHHHPQALHSTELESFTLKLVTKGVTAS